MMRRMAIGVLLVLVLAGCAGSTPSLPARPPVPASWHTVASTSGDVRVTLPADLEGVDTTSGVFAKPTEASGSALLEVFVTGPGAVNQPDGDEPRGDWLYNQGWLPRVGAAGVTEVGERTENALLLPSGEALEAIVIADVGEQAQLRVVAYAIDTEFGSGIVFFRGAPAVMDQRAADIRLIASLVEFGPPAEPSSSSPASPGSEAGPRSAASSVS